MDIKDFFGQLRSYKNHFNLCKLRSYENHFDLCKLNEQYEISAVN
jgi:hypothetical protein